MKSLEVEQHLQECPECARAHASLRGDPGRDPGQRPLFSGASGPGEARSIVRARAGRAGRTPRVRPGRLLAVAASLALIVAAGWGLARVLPARSDDAFLTRGAGRRPCPLADAALAPVRRGVLGPAHGQAVVRGEARLLAPGEGPGGPGFPPDRRAPRLSPQPAGGGAASTSAASIPSISSSGRRRPATRPRPRRRHGKGFHMIRWTQLGDDVLGRLRPQRARAAGVRPPDSGVGAAVGRRHDVCLIADLCPRLWKGRGSPRGFANGVRPCCDPSCFAPAASPSCCSARRVPPRPTTRSAPGS